MYFCPSVPDTEFPSESVYDEGLGRFKIPEYIFGPVVAFFVPEYFNPTTVPFPLREDAMYVDVVVASPC